MSGSSACALAEECQQPFDGRIECDEALFGGRRKGERGWGAAGKVLVFGILKRNGRVRVFTVQGRSRKELLPLIREHTTPGTCITPVTGRLTPHWRCAEATSSSRRSAACQRGATTLTASKASGVMLSNDCVSQYRGVPIKFFHLFKHRGEDIFPLIYAERVDAAALLRAPR